MKYITRMLAVIALGCSMTSGMAQAASIQRMTIEEIGIASGGLGTSALANGGGWGNYFSSTGTFTAPPLSLSATAPMVR